MSTPIGPGEIHLWLSSYDPDPAPQFRAACLEVLSPEERERESRFHFAADRCQYLTSHALLRRTLSHYAPVDPTEWLFCANAYGRPDVLNTEAAQLGLSFNLSHTHGLIVLAVATHRMLGVDVENIVWRKTSIDLAERFFAADEVAALQALPPRLQSYRFFEYWTFKEAYIKARGMGLSLPLDQFSFHYPDDRSVSLIIQPELADEPARWQFWQFQPTADHLVAVCAECSAVPLLPPIVHIAEPMNGMTVSATVLRSSQARV